MNILYVHGMGGGGGSRIPRVLNEYFAPKVYDDGRTVKVTVRTYDFDPEIGREQIAAWVEELKPELVIGESLGSIQAMRIRGVPHILVSPSLGAPEFMWTNAWKTYIPGVSLYLNCKYHVKKGDRQKLRFRPWVMSKYKAHWDDALKSAPANGGTDSYYAFFGTDDHFMKEGIVRIELYEKLFGKTYTIYEGSHFMEEDPIHKLLIPKIEETLHLI